MHLNSPDPKFQNPKLALCANYLRTASSLLVVMVVGLLRRLPVLTSQHSIAAISAYYLPAPPTLSLPITYIGGTDFDTLRAVILPREKREFLKPIGAQIQYTIFENNTY